MGDASQILRGNYPYCDWGCCHWGQKTNNVHVVYVAVQFLIASIPMIVGYPARTGASNGLRIPAKPSLAHHLGLAQQNASVEVVKITATWSILVPSAGSLADQSSGV